MIDLGSWREAVLAYAWWVHAAAAAAGFLLMYLGFSWGAWLLTRRVLPRMGIGRIIDSRVLPAGQIRREVGHSLVSIGIFSAYGALTVALERAGFISIRWTETPWTLVRDLLILTVFNEAHFYAVHRCLHTRWLMRHVHVVHHRSVIPTPFSTYAFHWFEATVLSSVMLLALLIVDLGIGTVLLFPVISLALNTIGHLNYALLHNPSAEAFFAGCRRHSIHHAKSHGNYGFYLPFIDQWLGTRLPAGSAAGEEGHDR